MQDKMDQSLGLLKVYVGLLFMQNVILFTSTCTAHTLMEYEQ